MAVVAVFLQEAEGKRKPNSPKMFAFFFAQTLLGAGFSQRQPLFAQFQNISLTNPCHRLPSAAAGGCKAAEALPVPRPTAAPRSGRSTS